MTKLLSCALTALVAATPGGCVPYLHVDASPVAGHVVDRITRQPIIGAKATLSFDQKSVQTRTDRSGSFRLAGIRHLAFAPLPYSMYIHPDGHLQVEAAGYQPYANLEFGSSGVDGYNHPNGVGGDLQHLHITLTPEGSSAKSTDGDQRH